MDPSHPNDQERPKDQVQPPGICLGSLFRAISGPRVAEAHPKDASETESDDSRESLGQALQGGAAVVAVEVDV